MKYLLITDIHLNKWSSFGMDTSTRMYTRLQEQRQLLMDVVCLAVEENVDVVVVGGDIFHQVGQIPTECLNVAKEFFDSLSAAGIKYAVCDGNHDLVVRKDPEWFHSGAQLFSSAQDIGSVKLVGYSDVICYDDLSGYDLVVMHRTPRGAKVGDFTFDEGVDWKTIAKKNKFVYFGHIHQRQELSDNCVVGGSPMHLTFGDIGDRGVYVYDSTTGKAVFHKMKYKEFRTVTSEEDVVDESNYYRVLQATSKSDKDNVMSVIQPEQYEEKLKGETLWEIAESWVEEQGAPRAYLSSLEELIQEKTGEASKVFTGKVTHVHATNFLSLEEVEYSVKRGFTLVVGKSDVFKSNGSGKSTTFEALFWALFGRTTKGLTGNSVIQDGKKDCRVIVQLTDNDGGVFTVTRSRKEGLSVAHTKGDLGTDLTCNMRQEDAQKLLENTILGFGESLFKLACYFSQESLVTLTGLSDTQTTNLITDLLGFSVYDDLYEQVSLKIKDLVSSQDSRRVSVSRKRLKVDAKKEVVDAIASTIVSKKATLSGIEGEVGSAKKMIASLTDEVKGWDDRIVECSNDIASLKSDGVLLESQKEVALRKKKPLQEELKDLSSIRLEMQKSVTEIRADIRYNEKHVKTKTDAIESIMSQKVGVMCTVCGNEVTEASLQSYAKKEEKEKLSYEGAVKEAEGRLSDLQTKVDVVLEEITILEEKISLLDATVRDVDKDIRVNESKIAGKKESREDSVKLKEKVEQDILSWEDKILSVERRKASVLEGIKEEEKKREAELAGIEQMSADIVKIKETILEVDEQLGAWDFWKDAFSPKGIKSMMLDRFCNQFNTLVALYLSSISRGTMSASLSPSKRLKSGQSRNKLGLDIVIGERNRDYKALSGGEKKRVDLSLCLALNQWVTKRHGLQTGLLGMMVLDEVFSFMDDSGEETVGQLIVDESTYMHIFVVSHTDGVASYADNIWEITKKDGISTLRVVSEEI